MYRDGYRECISRERDLNLRSFASTVQEIGRSRELPRKRGGMPRTIHPEDYGVFTCEGRSGLWEASASSCPAFGAENHGNSSLG